MRKILVLAFALAWLAAPSFASDAGVIIDDDIPAENPIPEPTAALLLGAGLVAVGFAIRKRR